MGDVYEVDGQLFATEALAKEAIKSISPEWGSRVGYNRPTTPRHRKVHHSMSELLSWTGKHGQWSEGQR